MSLKELTEVIEELTTEVPTTNFTEHLLLIIAIILFLIYIRGK